MAENLALTLDPLIRVVAAKYDYALYRNFIVTIFKSIIFNQILNISFHKEK